jgi:replication-associated recombination protein RarA
MHASSLAEDRLAGRAYRIGRNYHLSAASPKSNSAYLAIDSAMAKVEKTGNLPVPLHLRNAPIFDERAYYGKEYKYAHD